MSASSLPKGSIVSTWKTELVVPLFVDSYDLEVLVGLLPAFDLSCHVSFRPDLAVEDHEQLLYSSLQSSLDVEKASILVALEICKQSDSSVIDGLLNRRYASSKPDEFTHTDLLDKALKHAGNGAGIRITSSEDWYQLVHAIIQNVQFAVRDHPLLEYANNVIPTLSSEQLKIVSEAFQLDYSRHSSLAIQKQVREKFSSQQIFGVLLDSNGVEDNNRLKRSCIPTARLELACGRRGDQHSVQLISLFDSEPSDQFSVGLFPTEDSVEFRDVCMQQYYHRSCACLRCRYEFFTTATTLQGSKDSDLLKLARHYMGTGDMSSASAVLLNLTERPNLPDDSNDEAIHALGAIALINGDFIRAQKIWDCKGEPKRQHQGLTLQYQKQVAYNYLGEAAPRSASSAISWISPVPGVFTASAIDPSVCRKVIGWAEHSNRWTQSRHYAVPTYDIPVHTMEGSLLPWFVEFMESSMQPSLSKLFGSGRYHVHDAFCVRYDASSKSSHLPIRKC